MFRYVLIYCFCWIPYIPENVTVTLILNMFDIDVFQRRQSRRKKTHMHNAAEMKILDSTDLVFGGMLDK